MDVNARQVTMRTSLLLCALAYIVASAIAVAVGCELRDFHPIVVAGVAAYVYLIRSLPIVDGEIAVPGLTAPVEIVRDRNAIPHIIAATKMDAFFGLGYAHAQDRLWQMEFQRRVGHGRLSEIFGPSTIAQDRFLRTVGFGRAAAAAWKATPDWAQQQINAYVAGLPPI